MGEKIFAEIKYRDSGCRKGDNGICRRKKGLAAGDFTAVAAW
jgi:hypothetical protein